MKKHRFEVELTKDSETVKQTVFGFGKDEESAREDVYYQLCEVSKIPRENVNILRMIYVS